MAGIENPHEARRIAARADVLATLGMRRADDDQRRSGDEIAAVPIQPIELLGAHQRRRFAIGRPQLRRRGEIDQILEHRAPADHLMLRG
jgi:hypothetical protein